MDDMKRLNVFGLGCVICDGAEAVRVARVCVDDDLTQDTAGANIAKRPAGQAEVGDVTEVEARADY
jgi:hypothetical protein